MDEEQELKRLRQKKDNHEITLEEYEIERMDIEEREYLLEELKQKLENHEIDNRTYNKLSYQIINRSKNEEQEIEDLENTKSHAESRIRIHFKTIIGITIIVVTILSIISVFEIIRASKISPHIITGVNRQNLPEPTQGTSHGAIYTEIDDTGIEIEKLAAYTIYGKVVSIHNYTLKKDIYSKLSPVDFTIAYGEGIEFTEKLNFSTNSDRTVYLRVKNKDDEAWFRQNQDLIFSKISNNHMLYADEKIKDLLLQVRVGDYVKIKGYLVNVKVDGYPDWTSSLSRDDHNHHYMNPSADKDSYACEILYVTEINWLE